MSFCPEDDREATERSADSFAPSMLWIKREDALEDERGVCKEPGEEAHMGARRAGGGHSAE